jgi:single-stranded DNA-specific DHH superfamily exonuclease
VGVAWVVVKVLCEPTSRGGQEEQWLDPVALGAIPDVAILRDDNRYLVQRGLPQFVYKLRPGIDVLFRTAGITPPEVLDTEVVGFTRAPG